jgi:hypothetical protein
MESHDKLAARVAADESDAITRGTTGTSWGVTALGQYEVARSTWCSRLSSCITQKSSPRDRWRMLDSIISKLGIGVVPGTQMGSAICPSSVSPIVLVADKKHQWYVAEIVRV